MPILIIKNYNPWLPTIYGQSHVSAGNNPARVSMCVYPA
jgi:hypothetical protein